MPALAGQGPYFDDLVIGANQQGGYASHPGTGVAYVVFGTGAGFPERIDLASLDGTDPDRLALPLSFLHHFAAAPAEWRAGAHGSRRVEMNRMAKDAINPKAALHELIDGLQTPHADRTLPSDWRWR